jgi:hypothetical protein
MGITVEKIYNTFLKVSRTQRGLPFRYRKDFSQFEKEKNYASTLKLQAFFKRNPSVNVEDFFIAPYVVFQNDKEAFYDLDFYNKFQAIKIYTLFSKKLLMDDPDSPYQLEKIKDGLLFIREFCIEKKIHLTDYLGYKSETTNDFLVHLKNKNISIYNLFIFKKLDLYLRQYDFELLTFILGDLASRIYYMRTKFYSSKIAKKLCYAGAIKIEKKIKETVDKPG